MSELPPERVELLKKTLPTLPILPLDLFSRGSNIRWDTFKHTTAETYVHHFPNVLDLKVNSTSGVYDVAALTNWGAQPVTRELSLVGQLGLATRLPYLVFDFWNRRLLGVFADRVSVEIAPHDTRVLTIRPVLERPQLIGISRHISGTYSVLSLAWDTAAYRLHGASQGVPGEDYTLFVHVPEGIRVTGVAAIAGRNQAVPVRWRLAADLLQVTFNGQAQAVQWTLSFRRPSRATASTKKPLFRIDRGTPGPERTTPSQVYREAYSNGVCTITAFASILTTSDDASTRLECWQEPNPDRPTMQAIPSQ